jgi:hypothetical protein
MDVDVNVGGDDIIASSPHRSQRHRHHHHLSQRDAPVRLPPVPRRADQLMEKVVSKNLVERSWVSTLTPMDTFTPSLPARRGDFEDPALADPHLQVYWERQRTTAAAAKYKRRKQRDPSRNGGNNVFNRRITEAQRAATGNQQRHQQWTEDDRRGRSASRTSSSSSNGGNDDDQGSSVRRRRRCPIPLNETPLGEGELLCLRNLLCPMGGLQSSLTLENIDLRWLRERIEDPDCFSRPAQGVSPERGKKALHKNSAAGAHSDKEQHSSSPSTAAGEQQKRRKGVPPLPLSTLRNFDVDALADDSFHHTSLISFKTALITSPRSALVMLRNGVRLYALLRRPMSYYVAASETISDKNLQLRFDLAENERIMLLESLRSQYDQLCGIVPFERVSELLCTRQEVDHDAAREIAHERTQRDMEKLRHHEAREQRFGDLQIEREEVATQRLMALEEKLEQQQARQKLLLKERGEYLRDKAAAKLAAIAQVREEQEQITKETAEMMELHRQQKLEAIQEMKQERAQELHERAELNAQRISESRRRILDQDEDEAQRMQEYRQHKREQAEAFMKRKEAEHEALRKRAGHAEARRHHVKEKSAQEQEALRDKIEAKVEQAAHRFDMFLTDKADQRKALRIMHHVREIKSRRVLQQAQDAEKAMIADIMAASEEASNKLKARRHRQAKEQRRAAEAHQFDIAQRQRVVTAKVQQSEFDKLLQLARMQQTEELLQAHQAVQKEAVALTREGDKKVQLQRQQSKAMLEARAIDQAKALFQRTVSLKKEAAGASVARMSSTRATSADCDAESPDEHKQERRHSSYFRDVGSRVSSEETSRNGTPLTSAMTVPRSKSVEPHVAKKKAASDPSSPTRSASAMGSASKGQRQQKAGGGSIDKKPPRHAAAKDPSRKAPADASVVKTVAVPKQPPSALTTLPVQANPLEDGEMSDARVSSADHGDVSGGEDKIHHVHHGETCGAVPSTSTDLISTTDDIQVVAEERGAALQSASPGRSSVSSYPDSSHPPAGQDDHSSFMGSGDEHAELSPTHSSRPASKASAASSGVASFRSEINRLAGPFPEPTTQSADGQQQQQPQSAGPHVIVEASRRPSSRVSIILDAHPQGGGGGGGDEFPPTTPNNVARSSDVTSVRSGSAQSSNDRPLHARGSSLRQKQNSVMNAAPASDENESKHEEHEKEPDSSDAPPSDYYSDSFASEGESIGERGG